MTLRDLLFWMYAVSACGGALAVVCSQNVARMVFGLIVSLGSVAGLFMLLGADFIGLTQLLVYVGGTLVLLIFGIMLTATGPLQVLKTRPAENLVAAVVGLGLFGILLHTAGTVPWQARSPGREVSSTVPQHDRVGDNEPLLDQPERTGTSSAIALALVGLRTESNAAGKPRAGYLLPFELLSVHLLVVLIGAAYLARARRHPGELVQPTDGGAGDPIGHNPSGTSAVTGQARAVAIQSESTGQGLLQEQGCQEESNG